MLQVSTKDYIHIVICMAIMFCCMDMKPILRQLIVSHALSQDWENTRDTILQADESDDIEH